VSEIEELRRLVVGLAQNSKAEARRAERRHRRSMEERRLSPPHPLVYAEVAQPKPTAAPPKQISNHRKQPVARRAADVDLPDMPRGGGGGDVELSSLSSGNGDDGEPPVSLQLQGGVPLQGTREDELDDVASSAASEVLSVAVQPPSIVPSTAATQVECGDHFDYDNEQAGAPGVLGSATARISSSLNADLSASLEYADYDTFMDPPEDAVTSSGTAMVHPTPQDGSSNDIAHFVAILRSNREKLIATGLYGPQDPLIEEMDRKIEMYDRWCRQLY
jgi:hypothetical protein